MRKGPLYTNIIDLIAGECCVGHEARDRSELEAFEHNVHETYVSLRLRVQN